MKVLITGATGMIGSIILKHCLQSDLITSVISFVRRKGDSHPKLTEVIPTSFLDYSGLEEHFKNVDVAYFCIGVYTGAVPDNKFKEITLDYTVSFADMLKSYSPKVNFCLLSGAGADQTEKSRMSFARYKGMAENYLKAQQFGNLHLLRPGYIYPVEKRKEPNLSYRLFRFLYPLMKMMGKKYSITSEELGKAMFELGIRGSDKVELENDDLLRFIG